MGKGSVKKSFLDLFKVKDSDDDYDDDDYFDDDYDDDYDDDDDYVAKKPFSKKKATVEKPAYNSSSPSNTSKPASSTTSYSSSYSSAGYQNTTSYGTSSYKKPLKQTSADNKLVSFDNTQRARNYNPSSEVYVIRPVEFDDAQTVSDFLKAGKTIVINMEGVQLDPAQRIIDFIGGACYGLGGDLKAISANIFIAAPNNIEVSGDLRDEILNESTLSPQLGKY